VTRAELQAEWERLERAYHGVRRDVRPLVAVLIFLVVGMLALFAASALSALRSEPLSMLSLFILGPLLCLIPLGVVGFPVALIFWIRDRSRVERRRREIQQEMSRVAERMAVLDEIDLRG
jgi:hypothetical protein